MEKENCVPDFEKWALYYADLGYPVFPIYPIEYVAGVMKCRCDEPECARPGHHPLIEPYPHGATTNPQRIRKWGELYPRLGIGIPTGKISGLVAVEFDREFPNFSVDYGRKPEPHEPYPWETEEYLKWEGECERVVNIFGSRGYFETARFLTYERDREGYIVNRDKLHLLFRYPENFRFTQKEIEAPLPAGKGKKGVTSGYINDTVYLTSKTLPPKLCRQKFKIYSDGDFIVPPPSPHTGAFIAPETHVEEEQEALQSGDTSLIRFCRVWAYDRDWIYDCVGWEQGYDPDVSPAARVYGEGNSLPDRTLLTRFGFNTSIGLTVSPVLEDYFSGRGKEILEFKQGQEFKEHYDRYCEYFRKHRVLELPEVIKKLALDFGCGEAVIEGPKPKAQPNLDTPISLKEVERVIGEHLPNLLPATKACLAVAASLSFYDQPQPITLILVGGSSSGKTTALDFTYPDEEELKEKFIRVDDFSPKSFVSHHATRSSEKLEQTDLLPQLEDKILLTLELSTILRGKEDEIVEKFKILTPILDGKGYVSCSGTHGRRGYDRDINFNWIGCTTPPSPNVYRVMNNLGTRLVFFAVETRELSEDELTDLILDDNPEEKKAACKSAVQNYLRSFFKRYPPRSVSTKSIKIDKDFARKLSALLRFFVKYRAEVSVYEDNYSSTEKFRTPSPEAPHRIREILKALCRGNALTHGREEVTGDDLEFALHIALSSAPEDRRLALSCIIENGGLCTPGKLERAKKMSKNTAKMKLRELVLLDIVEEGVSEGDENNATAPLHYRLKDEWHKIFGLENVPRVVRGMRSPEEAA